MFHVNFFSLIVCYNCILMFKFLVFIKVIIIIVYVRTCEFFIFLKIFNLTKLFLIFDQIS